MGFFDRLTAAITGEEVTPDDVRDDLELARAYLEHGDLAAAHDRLTALAAAHWITRATGGHGAVREVCDLLLAARGC